jgi:predicted regulator of Ras-like GTPase activity (Roadblock/LC7/MglB family)
MELPLVAIVAGLPPNLAALVVSAGGGTFALPVKTALAQLASGAVRITFGELRQGSPPGAFADNASQDGAMVSLPLAQILASLDPAALARRPGQKTTTVPESVTSVFGRVRPLSEKSTVIPAPNVAPETAAAVPTPIAAPHPPSAGGGPRAVPHIPLPAPKPPPAEPGASPFARRPQTQALPANQPKPGVAAPRLPSFAKPPGAAAPASISPKTPTPGVMPFALPKTPAMPAPAAAPVVAEPESLVVEISALMEGWPEPVRGEIEQFKLGGATVLLPMARVDSALKTGRVVFTWGELWQWLRPAPTGSGSAHRETALELPLRILAPRFLAQKRPGAGQKQVTIPAQIPDLFAEAAKAPETTAPAPAPATTASAIVPATPAPAPSAGTGNGLGELLGEPGKSEWPPQEITRYICALPGVAGSVLATSDGLLMAGQMPAPMRLETMAAFLPQLVGRAGQYAGEMQLGPVTEVALAAGRGRCAIYKTGRLYLAVLGQAGEALPEAMLGRIAAELAKRNP